MGGMRVISILAAPLVMMKSVRGKCPVVITFKRY